MTDSDNSKLWNKLDKIESTIDKLEASLNNYSLTMAKIGTRLDAKDRDCARGDSLVMALRADVDRLKINQAWVTGAAVAISAALNYILKGLGVQ